ncbi:aminoacyl--tRNA ligase-related protein [Candidatus Pelagibacter sp. HIMB1483]|uniref:aminoacyl--tRNA ligase-related protein n=1 Tax=Candidatus Pelagibacter sp. HIMB1483 TaxID=3415414 RepID=UPI003F87809B
MKTVYKHNHRINDKQKSFILNSLKDSFPKSNLIIKKNKIFLLNKKNYLEIKKNCPNLMKLSITSKNKIIFYQNKKIKYKKNPISLLKKKKEIIKISEGLFQFQGNFLKVFRSVNKYFYDLALKEYNAIDQEHPVFWPIDLYKKIDYFKDFPQQILMVSGLKKSFNNYKKFSNKYGNKKNFKSIKINNQFRNSNYGLQPAVCDNCYYALQNVKNHKNSIYTTYNKVFRDEKSNFKTLDRLISFSVRDIMFVGDEQFVLRTKNKLVKSLKKFFQTTMLNCRIEVANDPFFISNVNKKVFQDAMDLKYEIIVEIPFLKKEIAVGSINFHLNTFGKAFKIKRKGKFIFSGCIGIGFERLLLALYSQHGININKWPKKLKKILNL